MKYKVLLDRSENISEVEAQEQARFVKSVLEAHGIPNQFDPDEPLSVEAKMKLRKFLTDHSINIIDDMHGGLKVFAETELIAEWKKPSYIYKTDKTKLYAEMHVSFWTAYEEVNE